MSSSYYIDVIERNIKKLPQGDAVVELWKDYNNAFKENDDKAMTRKLRLVNQKLNKLIDLKNMD